MKFVLVVLVALLAIQSTCASSVALRLKAQVEAVGESSMSADSLGSESIPATQLLGSASSAIATPTPVGSASSASTSASSASASASASPCNSQPACTQVVDSKSSSDSDSGVSPDDALKPIADWIKDFKNSAGADSNDLLSAAKVTVRPLIDKLKRNQEAALEKLRASNKAIVDHVEEATTEHVYNLLRAEKVKEDKEEATESKKEKLAELKSQVDEKKLQEKILTSSESSESSASF